MGLNSSSFFESLCRKMCVGSVNFGWKVKSYFINFIFKKVDFF